jgi:4-hydroxybenzoate polyprenyltransferase
MIVSVNPSGLKETKWHEYAIRFIFGGLITAIAGLIGKHWGPVVGGLFLAFPAIFPSGATMVEKHERERKTRQGLHGKQRGIDAAADDAMGAAMGSVGLLAFALIGWLFIPRHSPGLVLPGATLAWLLVATSIWILRKRRYIRCRGKSARRTPDTRLNPAP